MGGVYGTGLLPLIFSDPPGVSGISPGCFLPGCPLPESPLIPVGNRTTPNRAHSVAHFHEEGTREGAQCFVFALLWDLMRFEGRFCPVLRGRWPCSICVPVLSPEGQRESGQILLFFFQEFPGVKQKSIPQKNFYITKLYKWLGL